MARCAMSAAEPGLPLTMMRIAEMKTNPGMLGKSQLKWCTEKWDIFAMSAKQVREAQEYSDSERERIERANAKAERKQ